MRGETTKNTQKENSYCAPWTSTPFCRAHDRITAFEKCNMRLILCAFAVSDSQPSFLASVNRTVQLSSLSSISTTFRALSPFGNMPPSVKNKPKWAQNLLVKTEHFCSCKTFLKAINLYHASSKVNFFYTLINSGQSHDRLFFSFVLKMRFTRI